MFVDVLKVSGVRFRTKSSLYIVGQDPFNGDRSTPRGGLLSLYPFTSRESCLSVMGSRILVTFF